MSVFESIILGILQGIAEFLPVSSSGHLKVAQHFFGLNEVPLLFDVFLHLATLCSVVLYFRKKIWNLLCVFFRMITFRKINSSDNTVLSEEKNQRIYIGSVILATIVTGAIGIFTSKLLDEDKVSLKAVSAGFIVTALLLIFSALIEKRRSALNASVSGNSSPKWWQALITGFAQGIGTLPGISRSGSTIAGSLFCGVKRNIAGEFSFIISIPAIAGAFLLELKDLDNVSKSIGALPVIAGCAAAFSSGYLALTWLMKLIRKGRLEWFACYLIPLGILGIIFF